MKPRIVVVPQLGTGPTDCFYSWLSDTLAQRATVIRPDYLRPSAPRIAEWSPIVLAQLWTAPEQVIVLGHGLGCRAALHALSQLLPGRQVGGLLCVAGWWPDQAPPDTPSPWCAPIPTLARAREAVQGRCQVLLAEHNPDVAANQATWEDRMGAAVTCLPSPTGFNQQQEPAVLTAIESMLHALSRAPAAPSGSSPSPQGDGSV